MTDARQHKSPEARSRCERNRTPTPPDGVARHDDAYTMQPPDWRVHMTDMQRETVTGWWGRSKEIVTFAGGLILILVTITGLIQWSSGGLQLQSQIDLKDVRSRLDSIQTAQADQVKTAQVAQDRIIARLDALPRPGDYTAQESRVSGLDGRVSDLQNKMTGALHDIENLMHPPTSAYRNPPR